MSKTSHACTIITLLLVLLLSGSAWSASISGAVTNSTTKSGPIYLMVIPAAGGAPNYGTSIPAAGSFTIRGVPQGNYLVRAFIDTQRTGIQHANDPRGSSAEVSVPATGTVSVGSFEVADPPPSMVSAPEVVVYGGSNVNFVKWRGTLDSNRYPVADRYTVEWSSSETGAMIAGSAEVRSGYDDYFVHQGAASLYYRVTAHGTTDVSSGWINVSPSSGAGSVTGTVAFGATATGPLYVALINEYADPPVVRVAAVPTAASGGGYTVTAVPAGTYNIITFVDENRTGSYDVGDFGMLDTNDYNPQVTVGSSQVSAAAILLDSANASTIITTGHGRSQTSEWFNLVLSAHSMRKQVVRVTMAGPQLGETVDVARENGRFHTRIGMSRQSVNDSYQITLYYSDGTSETVTERVTGVLDGFATPTAPLGLVTYNGTPTFTWSPPQGVTNYLYTIWLSNAGTAVWNVWGLPGSRTSIVYGSLGSASQPTLTDGGSYTWMVNVTDSNGNMTAREVSFTTTSSPTIAGFSPAGGVAGTSVTITGMNFPASPAVNFNGTNAMVTAATSSSITVTVPPGAGTGPIRIVGGGATAASEKNFIVANPINITGLLRTTENVPISGARIEVVEDPAVFVTTGDDGSFTLQPLFPGQDVTMRMSATGYVPTYSVTYADLAASQNVTPYPYHLYTQTELNTLGVDADRGMIAGQVMNNLISGLTPVPGAQVSAVGDLAVSYPASYRDGAAVGTSTLSNGQFFIVDVRDLDNVDVTASKTAAWTFSPTSFTVRANSVTEGRVLGSSTPPSIGSFSPPSAIGGDIVVINGVNFSATASDNVVRFNGIMAEITAATSTALTVRVPTTARTGNVTVTTVGMMTTSPFPFTVLQTLTVTVTGSGTVTSIPPGISCRGTTGCSGNFEQNSSVRLVATADDGSSLGAWGGDCTGNEACLLAMSLDRNVAATFGAGDYIRNGNSLYGTLHSALEVAASGSTIQMQDRTFTVNNVICGRPVQVRVVGGYDSTFSSNGGFTTLVGTLFIQDGTIRMDRLKLR